MMTVVRNIDDEGSKLLMQYIRELSDAEFTRSVNASVRLLGTGRYEVEIVLPADTVVRSKKTGRFTNATGEILERVLKRMRDTGYPLVETEQ